MMIVSRVPGRWRSPLLALGLFGLMAMGSAGPIQAQGIPDPVPPDAQAAGGLDPTNPDEVAEEPDAPPTLQVEDTVELIFEREVFGYPAYDRRNPFRPLLTVESGGPRFEDLRLVGTIVSATPGQSVALFTVGAAPAAGAGGGGLGPATNGSGQNAPRALRAREGERVGGNTTIVEIQADLVVVEVEEFGARERRVMRSTRPGGGQGGPR